MLPSEASGANENSAIGDYVWTNTGWTVAIRGGAWYDGSSDGSFNCSLNNGPSHSGTDVGSRIMYVPAT